MPVILAFASGVSVFPRWHQWSLSLLTRVSLLPKDWPLFLRRSISVAGLRQERGTQLLSAVRYVHLWKCEASHLNAVRLQEWQKNVWSLLLQVCCAGLLRRLWRTQQSGHGQQPWRAGGCIWPAISSPRVSCFEALGCSCQLRRSLCVEPERWIWETAHALQISKVPRCRRRSRRKCAVYKHAE